MRLLTFPNYVAENRARMSRPEDWPTLVGHNRKEIGSTRNNSTSPIWHIAMINTQIGETT